MQNSGLEKESKTLNWEAEEENSTNASDQKYANSWKNPTIFTKQVHSAFLLSESTHKH